MIAYIRPNNVKDPSMPLGMSNYDSRHYTPDDDRRDGRRDERLAVCETCEHQNLDGPAPTCRLLGKCASRLDQVLRGYADPPPGCPLTQAK
jgi:hypothetical protein